MNDILLHAQAKRPDRSTAHGAALTDSPRRLAYLSQMTSVTLGRIYPGGRSG